MNLKYYVNILVVFTTLVGFSQENLYTSFSIPDNLKQHANAVIRQQSIDILIKSADEMIISEDRIITVLNKYGDRNIDAYVGYDKTRKIKDLEVLVFNDFGKEIKKIKKNDFKDVSAVDGGTLYSDSRMKYLEFTPISYPYTLRFKSVVSTSNTAFIQSFMPVDDYLISVENSSYTITYPEGITIRKKEKHIEDVSLDKEEHIGKLSYKVKNVEAIKLETYSPLFRDIVPKVLVALNEFSLEGVKSKVENWDDFGKWMYHDLIKDTHDLPVSTINMVQNLVKDETNNIDKAKKIYQFVQDKTRYISVQVGIGGWKPFNASEVDKLGYGDCKALTNYTMSLLKAANVESNYCVVWGGDDIINIEEDFASMQGNHVFLNIPNDNEDIWLECTSQKVPFGFIANGTDDRDVLVISSEGGKIKHTKKYNPDESIQIIKGNYSISTDGSIKVSAHINSKGLQYGDKLSLETEREQDRHYKNRWRYINDISINELHIENRKDAIEFVEDVSFEAGKYAKIIGDRMLFTINALNRHTNVPNRYKTRMLPLKLSRGFKDVDEVKINLPDGFTVEALPEDTLMETKFGSYQTKIELKDDTTIYYKRIFIMNDGEYSKEDYDEFREFYKTVARKDNAKIALIKK
ncbi:DUF3857 domain-containing transglutaminase family protein [Tamlana sp. 2201CG12-4]|uniref:DUF3857 domain-containing transglutaminase family protein n=1 Tax=Tamlana sp. 2201CG12-4 TaxID=3112582 RepID=UPI002DB81B14|nr:DUF3857 domain-containing transglutaminase family protein [Tamlana sp. 2201CG12-4]MEC3905601.1 DUF3857 domain-containing transglutaminase family protein [Tamlana sp. 2201CG12-4]